MSQNSTQSVVCTLFEGDYHYGVGALVNSLYHHGFRGTIWAGYRGELPPWASPLQNAQHGKNFQVAPGCNIRFTPVDTSIFFANYKPHFILDLWKEGRVMLDKIFYFDPDIVIKCRWSFFEEWADCGVALCLDSAYPHMPSTHPLREGWVSFAGRHGYTVSRRPSEYYNSGFIGIQKKNADLIEAWRNIMDLLLREGEINTRSFKNFEGYNDIDRSHPFYVADQDALNLAAMITASPVSVIGTDGMDFTGAGFTMSHAVDAPKPWRGSRLLNLLAYGRLPGLAHREYLRYTQNPISLYSPVRRATRMADYFLSKAVGSVFHRH